MIAAYLLEVHDDDLEWDVDCFRVKGVPEMSKTMTVLGLRAEMTCVSVIHIW
jgi:aerobic carbon-monoxide dehydrogenase large subunit